MTSPAHISDPQLIDAWVRDQLRAGNYVSVWKAEIDQDPEELPDDQIIPDEAEPLPDDPEVKTDPVPEE